MNILGDFNQQDIQSEVSLITDLSDTYSFGLKGVLDRLIIDGDKGRIIDFKTTSKTISEFKDTVEYYNYWMQAAIYLELVSKIYNLSNVGFTFIVIDKYKQVYCFDVSDESIKNWRDKLYEKLEVAKYHYDNRCYTLPHEFLTSKVTL
jgi:ATP-dependent exoDNAse (exonuclease V) beta subunit